MCDPAILPVATCSCDSQLAPAAGSGIEEPEGINPGVWWSQQAVLEAGIVSLLLCGFCRCPSGQVCVTDLTKCHLCIQVPGSSFRSSIQRTVQAVEGWLQDFKPGGASWCYKRHPPPCLGLQGIKWAGNAEGATSP